MLENWKTHVVYIERVIYVEFSTKKTYKNTLLLTDSGFVEHQNRSFS